MRAEVSEPHAWLGKDINARKTLSKTVTIPIADVVMRHRDICQFLQSLLCSFLFNALLFLFSTGVETWCVIPKRKPNLT